MQDGATASSGSTEAVILIKAAPQVGQKHGETVCCAGIDVYGRWLRLYPVSFRTLEQHQKFGRWDKVRFKWRRPNDDRRPESRRVDQQSIDIVGHLKKSERQNFLSGTIVTSLNRERAAGRSLALLRADILEFQARARTKEEIHQEEVRFSAIRSQADLFAETVTPRAPCPYQFVFRYRTDDGIRQGTCQDWEIEATYFNWSRMYGAADALKNMLRFFGEEYPRKGMLLAMGTHSRYPDTWLINGIVRLDPIDQPTLL